MSWLYGIICFVLGFVAAQFFVLKENLYGPKAKKATARSTSPHVSGKASKASKKRKT